jgi:hypothetical protein
MDQMKTGSRQFQCRIHITEFDVPPVHDGLVVGRTSPIGCVAIRKALELLSARPFEHIEINDETIGDIFVRAAILRRLPKDRLISCVLEKVKPLMGPEEILHLNLEAAVTLEEDL